MTSLGRFEPSVVAIGGGHGLASTLRAARRYAGAITAIVSVADDGGSSGRLRACLQVPAPGDLRMCLVALAEPGSIWARAFDYRFEEGELAGHAVGNLMIAGLASATGDFQGALDEVARLLGTNARVLPATTEAVHLKGISKGETVFGQAALTATPEITTVSLVPPDPQPPEAAIAAIRDADQVVIGPGSLFTSVLAASVVPALREAIEQTSAQVVYVANLRAQSPETSGLDIAGHIAALDAHRVRVDAVVCDSSEIELGVIERRFIDRPLAAPNGAHEPAKLAGALSDLFG